MIFRENAVYHLLYRSGANGVQEHSPTPKGLRKAGLVCTTWPTAQDTQHSFNLNKFLILSDSLLMP